MDKENLRSFVKPSLAGTNFGTSIANRLQETKDSLAIAACRDLGYPITFVREQLKYVAGCLESLVESGEYTSQSPEVAFMFPSNSEGAMPIYILALASSMGFRVHAKVSQRCRGIQACLERIFSDVSQVHFHNGIGKEFLETVLDNPHIRFIQVFGDDSWIGTYEEQVRLSGKTLAFDGPGKDPVLVLQGADLEVAVRGSIQSGLFAGGAACMSPERYLVHEELHDSFLESLAEELSSIEPMPPDDPTAVLGYLYSAHAVRRMREQIDQAVLSGAEVILDGRVREVEFAGREFYACPPIVLKNLSAESRILSEETFGPVFPVISFRNASEAVSIAEDCPYGLTAMVFGPKSPAEATATRLRESHAIVYVNETMLDAFRPEFWGSGGFKRSGWVWESTNGADPIIRTGYRPLHEELKKILCSVS